MTEGSHGAESPGRIVGLLAIAGLLWGCSSSPGLTQDAGPSQDTAVPETHPDTGQSMDLGQQTDAVTVDTTVMDTGATPDMIVAGPWKAGNPNGSCSGSVPATGRAVDTSNPTTIVGTGTAESCTFSQLQAAVAKAGIITFDCGDDPVTIRVTSTLNLVTTKDTVIDGGRKVTLDGGNAVQILNFSSANFQANDHGLTLQHLALANGKMTPTEAIPKAPLPCSQGWDDGEGGALYVRDGSVTIIDCIFTGNQAAQLGPDTGGGAIYVLGSKRGTVIVSSTFTGNSASNGGAVASLFSNMSIYDSLIEGNMATGNGANSDDATMCSVINNGQNEVGSGGNGGAVYNDGASVNVLLCGDAILNNAAGTKAFGGGLFFTSNDLGGTLIIQDTTMTGNTGGAWTNVSTGSTKNAGSAVGTNTKSLTISGSTLQGLP
jgi:hypothetical protein